MDTLIQDLRYAVRMLIKKPAFTAIAIITLALGVGANTAIFSVVNSVLLEPPPYNEPDRLVWLSHEDSLTPADFLDYREQAQTFEHIAAFIGWGVNLTGKSEPERLAGALVSPGFFSVLGVPAMIGHTFTPEQEQDASARFAVLSHGLWERRFGADAGVVGSSLLLNGESFTVVGVMPRDFRHPSGKAEVWGLARRVVPELPFRTSDVMQNRHLHYLQVIGRLKPNVAITQAQAEVDTIAQRLEQQYPNTNKDERLALVTVQEHVVGDLKLPLLILLGAVGFVLLIACANVANLMLVRASGRRREIAIRTALGAQRGRIIRQLLTESMLMALVGGGVGLLLALWGTDLLISVSPGALPSLRDISLDSRVLAFTLLTSLLTGAIFGLVPALQASKPNLNESLKEGSRSAGGAGSARVRNSLVVIEIALSLVLLAGAGLLINSFLKLANTDPGFKAEGVLTMRLNLSGSNYQKPEQLAAFYTQLLDRVEALPGIERVGAIEVAPVFSRGAFYSFIIDGQPAPMGEQQRDNASGFHSVSPDYFNAMGTPFLTGRQFNEADTRESAQVVIINQEMAERYWPGESPIGKRISYGTNADNQPSWVEIVGVVGNVRHVGLDTDVDPEAYVPYTQAPYRYMTIMIRTATDPESVVAAVRSQVQALDPQQPVYDFKPMTEVIADSLAKRRLSMLLIGIFAAVALLLAAVGIYGVMSYAVTERTREIGIRVALGAQMGDVMRLVVGQGMTLALIGIGAGLVVAFLLTRLIESLLYKVSTTDPATFVAITLLLFAVAFVASYIPARRAMRVDPMVALRYE
ncbi:MAG TPA: ABC transporter permease [Blastocatellia bacterium]|nr:ABC transporter permease [Blastocatellia bacterium]